MVAVVEPYIVVVVVVNVVGLGFGFYKTMMNIID
jgi:hypothetical protein